MWCGRRRREMSGGWVRRELDDDLNPLELDSKVEERLCQEIGVRVLGLACDVRTSRERVVADGL